MEYPSYSPDLAPCDFFLFGAMKQAFSGQLFDTIDDLLSVWRHSWESFCGLLTDRFSGVGTAIAAMP
jgi:hypothetical protein